ncbi:Flp family type IVb pilin [Undibacterium arcticum]|uniref:Flp family type IVb pilin n=1 Tax=Undibacterium arcticum TaxID=1762892 RepID=A0ABV7F3A9_9BURK
MNAIKKFMQDEEGAVAIEYALLAGLIALAIAAGATVLGKDICGVFKGIGDALMATPITVPTSFTACT